MTSASSLTILPPKIIPDSATLDDSGRGSLVTTEPTSRLLTCNCNVCGVGKTECVGFQCISTWEAHEDRPRQFQHLCANFTYCPEGIICCNDDHCNGVQFVTETSSTSDGGGRGIDLEGGGDGKVTTESGEEMNLN